MRRRAQGVETSFCVVANIPPWFHSRDLRLFFRTFIESGAFKIFHYRHRRQALVVPKTIITATTATTTAATTTVRRDSLLQDSVAQDCTSTVGSDLCCCVVQLSPGTSLHEFSAAYDGKLWTTAPGLEDGKTDSMRCRIHPISALSLRDGDSHSSQYLPSISVQKPSSAAKPTLLSTFMKARASRRRRSRHHLPDATGRNQISDVQVHHQHECILGIPELHPPCMLPEGNVGTPEKTLKTLIDNCRLPPPLVKSLCPNLRRSFTRSNLDQYWDKTPRLELEALSPPATTVACEEEWERSGKQEDGLPVHERNDRVEYEGDLLFEDKITLKWEKGGSGLVFYTDAAYWDSLKGDFDERYADTWDVEHEELCHSSDDEDPFRTKAPVGAFEEHTRGVGGKILRSQGWKEGSGVGQSNSRLVAPLVPRGNKRQHGLGWTDDSDQVDLDTFQLSTKFDPISKPRRKQRQVEFTPGGLLS